MFPGSIFPRNEKHHFGIISLVVLFLLGLEETQGLRCCRMHMPQGRNRLHELGLSVPFLFSIRMVGYTIPWISVRNRLRRIRGHAFENLTVKKIKIRHNMRKAGAEQESFQKGWKAY